MAKKKTTKKARKKVTKKVNSRQKGARHERSVANALTKQGIPARRGAQIGVDGGMDIELLSVDGVRIEAKHDERFTVNDLYRALEQSERSVSENEGDHVHAVAYRKNGRETLVVSRLADFLELCKRIVAGAEKNPPAG